MTETGNTPGAAWHVHKRHALAVAHWLVATLAIVLPVFMLAALVTFVLGAASGIDPAAGIAGDAASPATIARIRAEFGLDQPLPQQFLRWMWGLTRGDFGTSWFSRVPVTDLIAQRLAISVSIAGLALAIGIVAGATLGMAAAMRQGGWIDRTVTMFASVAATLPPFIIAIGLISVFSLRLHWLPGAGYVAPSVSLGGWLACIVMPAAALSVDVIAEIARQLRTGLVAAFAENYVTGARVRGLGWRRILFVHVLRNGAGPALSVLGLRVPVLIGGAVVTETIFTMPGIGMLSADSALRGDVPVVQGALIVTILFVLCANTLINLLQGLLLPASRRRA